ncbi:MAG: hypothetical protein WCK42_09740, partial [Myxococcaceae bacterium]
MLIYGASGHGRELGQLARICGYQVLGYLDDANLAPSILRLEEAKNQFGSEKILLGVGFPKIRRCLADK